MTMIRPTKIDARGLHFPSPSEEALTLAQAMFDAIDAGPAKLRDDIGTSEATFWSGRLLSEAEVSAMRWLNKQNVRVSIEPIELVGGGVEDRHVVLVKVPPLTLGFIGLTLAESLTEAFHWLATTRGGSK